MTGSRSELKWSIISESEGPSDGIALQFYVVGAIFTGTLPKKIGLLTARRNDDC